MWNNSISGPNPEGTPCRGATPKKEVAERTIPRKREWQMREKERGREGGQDAESAQIEPKSWRRGKKRERITGKLLASVGSGDEGKKAAARRPLG